MSKDWEEKFRPEDLQRIRGFRLMDDDFMSNVLRKYRMYGTGAADCAWQR